MNRLLDYVLLSFCLLFLSEGKTANYLLTMSKNDNVCQSLHKILNADLIEKGKLDFEQRKEFSWLEWDKSFYLIEPNYGMKVNLENPLIQKKGLIEVYETYSKHIKKGAFIDIDNDNVDEFVTFERQEASASIHRASDHLFIYDAKAFKNISGKERQYQYSTDLGYTGELASSYVLTAYPSKRVMALNNGMKQKYWPILVDPFIRLLRIDGHVYIVLIGNVDTHIEDPLVALNQTIDEKNGIALLQLTPKNGAEQGDSNICTKRTKFSDNWIEDICYFVKTQRIKQAGK